MLTGTQLGIIVEAVGRGMCGDDSTQICISFENGRYAIHWSEEDNLPGYTMYVRELRPGVAEFSNGKQCGKWESTEIDFNTRTVRVYRNVRECRHEELETKLLKQFDETQPPEWDYDFDEFLYILMTLQNHASFDTHMAVFDAAAAGEQVVVLFNKEYADERDDDGVRIGSYFFNVLCPRCRNWMFRGCDHCAVKP